MVGRWIIRGSLRTLDQKAAFKIKFDEFIEGQTFLGLKKLTLNNMVEDPSMGPRGGGLRSVPGAGGPVTAHRLRLSAGQR
jgi:hypothetical protein